MNAAIKIVLYILLLTASIWLGLRFNESYQKLQAEGAERGETSLGISGENYRQIMTYGALTFGAVLCLGLLFAHDFSQFMGTRALKVLNLDDTMGIRDTQYELADEAHRNGNYLEAIRLLREYLENHPKEIHALVRIAEIYDKDLQNYPAAAMEYERVLDYTINPERWGWLAIRLVNIYTGELGEAEKGIALLRRIVGEHGQTKAGAKARQRLALYEEAGAQAREKDRVMGVFSKLVSPDVVNELLGASELNFGGQRKRLTIMFADIRGFTSMTDDSRAAVMAYIEQHGLNEDQARAFRDQSARETLTTVNVYLSTIADMVKKHQGTLDKYMGDCVMAFWGAPAENDHHALYAVWAAIDSQQAIEALNVKRQEENTRREADNVQRVRQGLPPLAPLPILTLGIGVNTGEVIVGLMGSESHILNYTVFGREVNLASRLEGVAGSSRVIIGPGTYEDLLRDAPTVAERCTPLDPVTVKGIKDPVPAFSVPWAELEIEQADS